ncbi:hypothetical protein BCR32DRAFT_328456, partial [Anaeromyces robustus]
MTNYVKLPETDYEPLLRESKRNSKKDIIKCQPNLFLDEELYTDEYLFPESNNSSISDTRSIELITKSLDHDICVIDDKNISHEHTILHFGREANESGVVYEIRDINENILFLYTINYKERRGGLEDLYNNLKYSYSYIRHHDYVDLNIISNNNSKNKIKVKFKRRNTTKFNNKYTIEIFNNITKVIESFDLNYGNSVYCYNIYYGKKKRGGPLICNIKKPNIYDIGSIIEIAPGIDKAFIVVIIIGIQFLL